MTVFEEIVSKVNLLLENGIKPSVLIIGHDKMALFSVEEPYMKNWLVADYITFQVYNYKLDIFIDQNKRFELNVFGNERYLTSSF